VTTVFEDAGTGTRLHALVIGVGHYPRRAMVGDLGRLEVFLETLDSVSSAYASALAVADWLVQNRRADPVTPLGSVELLASWPGATFDGGPVDGADRDTVQAAFRRWFNRCDSNAGNVALLYFCGHGCDTGDQLLLLEDFGADLLNPFDHALNLRRLHLGMRRCRARTQVFLVDACRSVPRELVGMRDTVGWSPVVELDEIRPYDSSRDAPIMFSTAAGQLARGTAWQPTPYTRALLDVLGGMGAHKNHSDIWEVGTDRLRRHVCDVLEWSGFDATDHEVSLGGDLTGAGILTTLAGPPQVPFRICCTPRAAQECADLALLGEDQAEVARRGPDASVWCDEVDAGAYSVQATFPGGRFRDRSSPQPFMPPAVRHTVRVEGR